MRPVRVISYNVRYFGHATRGLASTKGAMKRIADAFANMDPLPDIICLQEVETHSIRSTVAHPSIRPGETQLERLMTIFEDALLRAGKKTEFEAYYFPAHAYRISGETHMYTTGLAILANADFTIDHHNASRPHDITHRHLHPIRKLKQTRICAHVRFRYKGGEPIEVFNTHLSLPSTMKKEFWTKPFRMGFGTNQLEEARNLVRFVEAERQSDRFFIVGDFNALPGSPVYDLLTQQDYVDPFARLHKMGIDELRAYPTAGFLKLRMHLDHIFTGRGIRWLDFEGSHPFGDRKAVFHGLSDHMPLIGTCRISRGRASIHPPT